MPTLILSKVISLVGKHMKTIDAPDSCSNVGPIFTVWNSFECLWGLEFVRVRRFRLHNCGNAFVRIRIRVRVRVRVRLRVTLAVRIRMRSTSKQMGDSSL